MADIEALRAGDPAAFAGLIDALGPGMLRMARGYVQTDASAEDVVQEAWMAVLKGLDGFEGRSSLETWILGIVINVARNRSRSDRRALPFSSVGEEDAAIGPERFLPDDHAQWPGHWAIAPTPWPDQALETAEARRLIDAAIDALPESQRAVILLRDMVGATAEETNAALGISAANGRVLLHRARARVRAALETAFGATQDLR